MRYQLETRKYENENGTGYGWIISTSESMGVTFRIDGYSENNKVYNIITIYHGTEEYYEPFKEFTYNDEDVKFHDMYNDMCAFIAQKIINDRYMLSYDKYSILHELAELMIYDKVK